MTDRFITLLLAGAALSALSTHALAQDAGAKAPEAERENDEAPTRLSQVVVTANSREQLADRLSPGVVSVVYPDDTQGEHKSLPDLLDQIPGVYARRVAGTGQYTTTSIRGSSPSQVNIYIDGVPYNTSSEVAADLSTLPMSNVERVEVYRGSTPARFSGAPLGGAINIVTKAPTTRSGSVSAGARSYEGYQFSANFSAPLFGGGLLLGLDLEGSAGNFEYDDLFVKGLNGIVYGGAYKNPNGEANTPARMWSDPALGGPGWMITPYSDIPVRRERMNNSFEKQNVLVKWRSETLTAKWSYTFMERLMPGMTRESDSYIGHRQDLPQFAWPQAGLGDLANQRRRQEQVENDLALGWRDSFGGLTLGVTLNVMDQDKRYRNLDIPNANGIGTSWSNYRTRRYGVATDAAWSLGEGGPIGQLIELHADYVDETLHADANNLVPVVGPPSDYYTRFKRERTSVQVQDTLTIRALGDLQITPIGRLEQLQGPVLGTSASPFGNPSGDLGWKPTWSLSVKKRFGEGWLIFANAGTYNRYPNFYEIYGDGLYVAPGADSVGNTIPLQREHGRNADLGFGWNGQLPFDLTGSFRATYFERRTEDAITYYATPIGAKYINSGVTFTQGGEFEGNLVWGKRADLQLAATVQEGRYVEGTYYYFGGSSALARLVDTDDLYTLQAPVFAASGRLNVNFLDGALKTYLEVKHTGKKYVYQVQDYLAYETPLTTVGLGARYEAPAGIVVTAGVSDVFDEGPKQQLKGGYPNHSYTWSTCVDPFDFVCAFLTPGTTIFEEYQVPVNVYYPQQGRTFYFTLTKKF